MSKVTLAITVVGGLVLFSGVLILVGAVAMTKFQRVYEAAMFKTLGASTRHHRARCCCSNTACSGARRHVGSLGAIALTWASAATRSTSRGGVLPGEHLAASALTAVLVAAIGVLSSLDVLRQQAARDAARRVKLRL